MRKNMQRLRRGELSRISTRVGAHTDVHMGAPKEKTAAATGENPAVVKLQQQLQDLQTRNGELEKNLQEAQEALDSQAQDDQLDKVQQELEAVKAEAAKLAADREELEKQLAEQPEVETATGLRVVKIMEVSETDDLMRIDCEFKPTSGPLGDSGAIILPVSEVDKLITEEEDDDNTEG